MNNMKGKLTVLVCALLGALVLAYTVSAKESAGRFDKGIFWKIEKDGEYVGHIFTVFFDLPENTFIKATS